MRLHMEALVSESAEAEKAFEDYWRIKKGGHVQRLHDKKDLMGLNKGRHIADFRKPSDFLVSSLEAPLHYAEVKSTRDPKGFHFSGIQDGQSAAALLECGRGSGRYIFYIFSVANHRWYVMDCRKYSDVVASKRRSVKFEELQPWVR